MSGPGIDVPILPKCPVPVLMYPTYRSVRYRCESLYRYRRYRYPHRAEVTEVSGTGIYVVPNLPKCPVRVLISNRTYRSVRYRYLCCTEFTEVSGTGVKVCAGTAGTGIHILPNFPKCAVPVLISNRTYLSVRCRLYRRYASVRTIPERP